MAAQANTTDTNNPSNSPKPKMDQQSPHVNASTQAGSSPTGGTTTSNTPGAPSDAYANANPSQNAAAVKSPKGINANQQNANDYKVRAEALNQNNNRQKVALVGRTGAGARALTGDLANNVGKNGVSNSTSIVVFEVTPEMNESGTTILVDIGNIRAAASIVIYMGSPSRAFTLNAKFVSRTPSEAAINQTYINRLKAWREPVIKLNGGIGLAEPETLRLFAYGDVLKGIPCMIQTLTIDYPTDVDYIKTTTSEKMHVWVPIIQNVSIALKEVRSFDDLDTFDYESFKSGILQGW